jgi:hypothetical protein
VLVGGFVATLLLSGGWQAVAIAVALSAGFVVLAMVIVLGAMRDGRDTAPPQVHLPRPARAEAVERAEPAQAPLEHGARTRAPRRERDRQSPSGYATARHA